MNAQRSSRPPQPRWGPVSGTAACGAGVGGFQDADGAPDQAIARYRHATDGGQLQQWPAVSIVAVSVRGKSLDKQRHHQARPNGAGRTGVDLLHPQGPNAQRGRLVRRHMGTASTPFRYGRRAAVSTAWRVRKMATAKRRSLPENRTYGLTHRPENRTYGLTHRPENRTYTGCFWVVPMPDFRTPSREAICTGEKKGGFYKPSGGCEGWRGPRGPPLSPCLLIHRA
jgi:hypothetical protein